MAAGSHDAINGIVVANDTGIGGSRGHCIHFLLIAARQACVCWARHAAKIIIRKDAVVVEFVAIAVENVKIISEVEVDGIFSIQVKVAEVVTRVAGKYSFERLQRSVEILNLVDRNVLLRDQIAHHLNILLRHGDIENGTALGRDNWSIGVFLIGLLVASVNETDWAEMHVNKPTQQVEIATLCCAVDGVHGLIILDVAKRATKVDVASVVESNGLIVLAIQKGPAEGQDQKVARFANLDTALLLHVVSFRNHLRRPSGGARCTDADAAVATMTRPTEDSKLASTDETVGRLGEGYHLGRGIRVGRLTSLTFGVE